ncbi:MAG: efflux RND transporter permease subunit [Candidatus Synoicihabitans palmerolidicus]|nr:efflux RND transporter permease subunit [Candidatus Synoicihabitans palmerolidicus]
MPAPLARSRAHGRLYDLTPLDVRDALGRENVELPSGRIEGGMGELSVRTLSRLTTSEEFNRLMVKRRGEQIVRMADIGYAELGPENPRSSLKVDGSRMVGVYISPQPGANQVEIADELHKRIAQIHQEKSDDIEIEVAYDNTEYVRTAIHEVIETLAIAFVLVVLVIFLFLRDWRRTLIPMLAIPVSIIGVFMIMRVAGFSINVLTLLAMVLAIGLVVDDAIVVLENIYAKIEQGIPPPPPPGRRRRHSGNIRCHYRHHLGAFRGVPPRDFSGWHDWTPFP